MNFKSILFRLFLSGFFVLSGQADEMEALSLADAVSAALDHNFSLAARKIESQFPETRYEIAKSEFRWNVFPSLRAERNDEGEGQFAAELSTVKKTRAGTMFEVRAQWTAVEGGGEEAQVDVRLEQPLFQRFGKLSAYQFVDESEFQMTSARLRFHRETENLILRVVRAYTDVLDQQERLKQEQSALLRAADLVRLVEVKLRQGHATGVDLLEMQMLYQEAELRFRQAEEALHLGRAVLAELMGRVSEQLPGLLPVPLETEPLPESGEAGQIARENRVERTLALLNYENERRKLALEERQRYPDVRVIGNWRPVDGDREASWFAGLRAGRELDLHVTNLEIERQEKQVQASLLQISSLELQIHREVLEAESRLKTLTREREIAEAQLELSRERLRLAKGLYPSGRTSAQQLRDAEEGWVGAQSQKTDVILQQVRARYQFWYALGLLLGDPGDRP
ncbi:MAG: TolC family protein [Kiritimatiellia bacterium]